MFVPTHEPEDQNADSRAEKNEFTNLFLEQANSSVHKKNVQKQNIVERQNLKYVKNTVKYNTVTEHKDINKNEHYKLDARISKGNQKTKTKTKK